MPTLADFLRSLSGPTDPPAAVPGAGPRKPTLTDILRETPEMVASVVTGMAGQAAGGWQGLAKLATTGGNLDEAVKAIHKAEDTVTYRPRSEGAQAGLQHVADVIEPINEFAREHVADPVGKYSPALGAALVAAPAALGPGEVTTAAKAAAKAAGTAAKAGKAALRGVEATEGAAAPVAASAGSLLRDRLQAVGDAQRAYSADGSPANGTALAEAQKALRLHREQRAAALRDTEPAEALPGSTVDLARQRAGQDYRDAPEALPAAMRAVRIAEDSGIIGPGPSPERDALFNRAFVAARDRIAAGGNVDHANSAAHHAAFSTPQAEAPRPVGALTPEHEARLAEVDPGGWMNMEGAQDPQAIAARARILTRRVLGGNDGEYNTDFLNMQDKLRYRMEANSGRGNGPFSGEDWIPEPPVTRPAEAPPQQRAPLRLAGQDYGATTRQDVLRQQKNLLPNVDPGWEHQTLIPGLEPLTPAQGAQQRARRLGVKTRILREGDPAMNRDAVLAFYEGGRDNPEMFQYGVDPKRTGEVGPHASLDDYAAVYGRRAKADIDINYTGGEESYPEPEPKRHGRGEPFRDEYGDYVMKKRTHEAGDVPVYDEHGDPKKVKVGLDEEGLPIKEKYEATGGEPVREGGRFGGSIKYDFKKTRRHGRPMRDERGDIKYEEPDYDNYDSGPEKIEMRAPGGGEIDVSDYGSGDASIYAGANTGKYGSLLYQTLFNHASHAGERIGGGGLSHINQLRILSNANSNYARTGVNPRNVRGTDRGGLPEDAWLDNYAEGPEIWRTESAEALKRATGHGGKPERMAFHPDTGFTLDGIPATPDELKGAFESMSPRVKTSGVGMKTLMRSAVFDWVRDAAPKEAAEVARNWGKKYGPLFGVAGVGLTLQDVLRERERGEQ